MIGSWISSNSPVIAEVMAQAGLDFLVIDEEHSPCCSADIFAMLQAIRSGGDCEAWVRVKHTEDASRYLDAGADGIIAPLVNIREQADILVEACLYPPHGRRGLGFCRANRYGQDVDVTEATRIFAQIEHKDALPNLDEILSVEGLDGTFIGPWDLSASMGFAGDMKNDKVVAAIDSIRAACERNGKMCGFHTTNTDTDAFRQLSDIYDPLAYSLDITIIAEALKKIRP